MTYITCLKWSLVLLHTWHLSFKYGTLKHVYFTKIGIFFLITMNSLYGCNMSSNFKEMQELMLSCCNMFPGTKDLLQMIVLSCTLFLYLIIPAKIPTASMEKHWFF